MPYTLGYSAKDLRVVLSVVGATGSTTIISFFLMHCNVQLKRMKEVNKKKINSNKSLT